VKTNRFTLLLSLRIIKAMSIYDGLKDAAKVLKEANKIEQYKEILDAQEKMMEMQERIKSLEEVNAELKKRKDIADELEYRDKSYWLDEDGPFCSRCWDADSKLVRLRQQNVQKSDFDCDNCGTRNIRVFPELYVNPSVGSPRSRPTSYR
jgi:hypothetical protein